MMESFSVCVRNFALQSRLFIIVLQVLFNYLIPDHDADVFSPPNNFQPNIIDNVIDIVFGGFRRWDAVYFLHIAEHGYTYENTLVFFPLFPLTVWAVANSALFLLQYFMSYASVLLISAIIVNTVCFVLSALTLFELGRIVLGNDVLAFRAAQFYCINPASIFFSAAYSESCYAFLAFRGMLLLERNWCISSAIFFALSGAARSNGLVNIGFLLHRAARDMMVWMLSFLQTKAKVSFSAFGLKVCQSVLLLFTCLLPFAAFQYYAYTVYCNHEASSHDLLEHVRQYGNKQGYRMPYMGQSAWCQFWPPLSYSYIQSSHWNVGLLSYYELKQIPNFLLAMPMATLCICMIVSYVWKHTSHCLCAGLLPQSEPEHSEESEYHCLPKTCFVYVIHAAFLLIFGILYMHIQVITRFIASSCPVIYWFVAIVTLPRQRLPDHSINMVKKEVDDERRKQLVQYSDYLSCHGSRQSQAIFVYFVLYNLIGVAAFVNFLPWT